MKKYLFYAPIIIYPYTILITLILLFRLGSPDNIEMILERYFGNNIFVAITLILVYYGVCIISVFITMVLTLRNHLNSKNILKVNLIIKCLQIPAYIGIFIIGLMCLLTIFTFGISVVLFLFDCFSIFLSGMIALSGIIGARKQGLITKNCSIIYGICSFIFCIDIVIAFSLYIKSKKNTL